MRRSASSLLTRGFAHSGRRHYVWTAHHGGSAWHRAALFITYAAKPARMICCAFAQSIVLCLVNGATLVLAYTKINIFLANGLHHRARRFLCRARISTLFFLFLPLSTTFAALSCCTSLHCTAYTHSHTYLPRSRCLPSIAVHMRSYRGLTTCASASSSLHHRRTAA